MSIGGPIDHDAIANLIRAEHSGPKIEIAEIKECDIEGWTVKGERGQLMMLRKDRSYGPLEARYGFDTQADAERFKDLLTQRHGNCFEVRNYKIVPIQTFGEYKVVFKHKKAEGFSVWKKESK